jgi:hypothetical protein
MAAMQEAGNRKGRRNMSAISELIERLEKADEPHRGLDGRIAWAIGWRFNGFIWEGDPVGGPDTVEDFDVWYEVGGSWKKPWDDKFFGDDSLSKKEQALGEIDERWENPPRLTGSIDAAVGLLATALPGWAWSMGTCCVTDDARVWPDFNSTVNGDRLRREFPELLTPNRDWHKDRMEWIDFTDVALNPPGRPAIALCISILIAVERINELKVEVRTV